MVQYLPVFGRAEPARLAAAPEVTPPLEPYSAQGKPTETGSSPTPQTTAASPAPAEGEPQLAVPGRAKLVMMVTATMLALNNANATGNYTVLHGLGDPDFQRNSPARLFDLFSGLRRRNLDLSPISLMDPEFVSDPTVDPNGVMRVAGFFPTQPEQVNFDVLFKAVDGQWRLLGLSVSTSAARSAAALSPNSAAVPQ